MQATATASEVFAMLSDRHTLNILKMAYSGFPASASSYTGNLSKKQFYTRLKKLREAGLVQKNRSSYHTTTLGSLVCNGQVKALEAALSNYWNLKAIDVLKARNDIPLEHKEAVISDLLRDTTLKSTVNSTHLNSFAIIKDFKRLITEVMKILENAREEIYFATRYHDPHVSGKVLEKFSKGVEVHLIDGNPEQSGLVNRMNAVMRTPPDNKTYELAKAMLRSQKFTLTCGNVPLSFVVVDRRQICYEVVAHDNPEEFTMAIASYDDPFMAQSFIRHFRSLESHAKVPDMIANVRKA